VDLNDDGFNDLLSGSYSGDTKPIAGLFQVLWGQADGSFKKAAVLNGTDGKPLMSSEDRICTRPMAVDWNGDGPLDLVVGNSTGTLYVFIGKGRGQFLPESKGIVKYRLPLRIKGGHSDPFPVDWDRDGDLDLLSGSINGGVQWAENSAGPGVEPVLKSFRSLIKPDQVDDDKPLDEADLTGPAGSTRVWVDDVNGDGKLDVIVGDSVTLVTMAEGLSREEFDQKQAQWQKDYAKALVVHRAAGKDTKKHQQKYLEAQERLEKLFAERDEFRTVESTGFVWLYLQK
jgi:hypothetical protein